MGWISQDTIARNPVVLLLTAFMSGVTSSAGNVSDGLNMILGGSARCILWISGAGGVGHATIVGASLRSSDPRGKAPLGSSGCGCRH